MKVTSSTAGTSSAILWTITSSSCTAGLSNKLECVFTYVVLVGYGWAFSKGQGMAVDFVYYFIGATVGLGCL